MTHSITCHDPQKPYLWIRFFVAYMGVFIECALPLEPYRVASTGLSVGGSELSGPIDIHIFLGLTPDPIHYLDRSSRSLLWRTNFFAQRAELRGA